MTKLVQINIDLDNLANIAHTGVRRAVLFMGLGLNAINQPGFRDYQLHKLPLQIGMRSLPVDFFPSDLPDENIASFKQEFSVWIAGSGLREILEHYALYLDNMHNYGLLIQQATGKLGQRDPEKEQRNFNRNGSIAEKLRLLNLRFSVCPEEAPSITQLYTARNCLTHDLGVVSAKHCDNQGIYTMSWTAFDMLAIGEETGTERPLADLIASSKPTTEPTGIAPRRVKRTREFRPNDKLRLSQQDLWELCYFFNAIAIPSALKSFVTFATTSGILVAPPPLVLPIV